MAEPRIAVKPGVTPRRPTHAPTAPIRSVAPTRPLAPTRPMAPLAPPAGGTGTRTASISFATPKYGAYAPAPAAPVAPVTPAKTPSTAIRDGAADAANKESWFAGVQTFFQGAVRTGVQVLKGAKFAAVSRLAAPVADFLEGGKSTIHAGQAVGRFLSNAGSRGVDLLGKGATALANASGLPKVAKVATDVAAAAGPRVAAAGTFAGKAFGATAKVVGKVAPALNVVSSTWETVKAFQENDPAKKNGAVANATLSWASTGMALGAVALGATPVGWGLAAGAAAVAGFQLVDSTFLGGKGTQWIGDTAAKTWNGAKNVASNAWNGAKNVASNAWEGTKNVASKLKFW